jgi:hypothetical protein
MEKYKSGVQTKKILLTTVKLLPSFFFDPTSLGGKVKPFNRPLVQKQLSLSLLIQGLI